MLYKGQKKAIMQLWKYYIPNKILLTAKHLLESIGNLVSSLLRYYSRCINQENRLVCTVNDTST